MTGNPDLPGPDTASSSRTPTLSYYGELDRRQWKGCLREIYEQIREPGRVLRRARQGDRRKDRRLAAHLAGDDQYGEGYPAKVARPTAARDHARQRVLGEYLLLPPATDMPADDDNDDAGPGSRQAGGRGSRPPVVGGGRCRAARTARRPAHEEGRP